MRRQKPIPARAADMDFDLRLKGVQVAKLLEGLDALMDGRGLFDNLEVKNVYNSIVDAANHQYRHRTSG